MLLKLPCYGIVIELERQGGTITSDLKEDARGDTVNAALDAVEAMILAHAVAGVDVSSPAYLEGIETVVEKIGNTMG